MTQYFHSVSPSDPFRQGDIFRRQQAGESCGWAVLVTADCDIANDKFGDHFTYLRIIGAEDYLENWASGRCQLLLREECESAAKLLHDEDHKRDPTVRKLSAEELIEWLTLDGEDAIVAAFPSMSDRQRNKCLGSLKCVQILNNDGTGLSKLVTYWNSVSRSRTKRVSEIRDALKGMKSEYIFLPAIPGEKDVGFIVYLRDIGSVHRTMVFSDTPDYLVSDSDGHALIRIGRLVDYLRFSIAQQLGALFSRIGMSDFFEAEREEAMLLIADGLVGVSGD